MGGVMMDSAGKRVLMLLENNPYSQDSRVRQEAQTLHRAGYQVTVVSPKKEPSDKSRSVVNGVSLYRFRAAPNTGGFAGYVWEYGYSTTIMFLLSVIVWLRGGFDVIHAHNPPDTLFLIGWFYRLFGKKFVFDHHDVSPEMYEARYGPSARPLVRRLLGLFERLTFRTADHVIAANESHRAIAIERGGVAPEAITIVRNGPIASKMNPTDPDPNLRSKSGMILAYVGIMGPQDGVDYLLRAIHHLIDDLGREDVYCVIIGRGDSVPDLKVLAETLGIADKVWFAGWISLDDLPGYLSAVDICVDPDPSNPYNDLCTMIKLMEYMAMGKPIVAFDLPEHRVSAQGAALYAQANDEMDFARKIEALMDDPERRRRMGEIGRKRVHSDLAWEHQEGNLLAAYEAVTGDGS
jgi:glycosyltransferase involved in cell wall biosynthesis